jgi:hypothetical protein
VADDKDHRLQTTKLAKIMEVAGAVLKSDDLPVGDPAAIHSPACIAITR